MNKRVVLVEDAPGDVKVISDALSRIAPTAKLEVFRDGLNAFDFFSRYNPDSKDPVVLTLVDLNVPRLQGLELLHEIQKKLPTRPIPIVIFTGTGSPEKMRQIYALGANSYVIKQNKPDRNAETIYNVLNYWLNINEVPE